MAPMRVPPNRTFRALSMLALLVPWAIVPLVAAPLPALVVTMAWTLVCLLPALQATATFIVDESGITRRTILGTRHRIPWAKITLVKVRGKTPARECIVVGRWTKLSFLEARPGFAPAVDALHRRAARLGIPTVGSSAIDELAEFL
jgi:hypothetical protein